MRHEVGGRRGGRKVTEGQGSVFAKGPRTARVGGICRLSLWTRMGMRRRKQRGLRRVWETGEEPVRDEEGCHQVPGLSVLSRPVLGGSGGAAWLGFPTEHAPGPLLVHTEHLPSPFPLQEGKVTLVENQFCNVLYRQRLSNSESHSVREEMLCAGDFSAGRAICQVSGAVSLLPACFPPCPQEPVLLLVCVWTPPGLCVFPSSFSSHFDVALPVLFFQELLVLLCVLDVLRLLGTGPGRVSFPSV